MKIKWFEKKRTTKQYIYFFSYSHKYGNGNVRITMFKDSLSYEDIKEVQDYIKDKYSIIEPIVIYYAILQG